MILNIVLLILGILFLFYGIRKKLKFWVVVGAVLLCFGAVSAYVDYTVVGPNGINNSRIPFVIDHFMQ